MNTLRKLRNVVRFEQQTEFEGCADGQSPAEGDRDQLTSETSSETSSWPVKPGADQWNQCHSLPPSLTDAAISGFCGLIVSLVSGKRVKVRHQPWLSALFWRQWSACAECETGSVRVSRRVSERIFEPLHLWALSVCEAAGAFSHFLRGFSTFRAGTESDPTRCDPGPCPSELHVTRWYRQVEDVRATTNR